MVFHYAGKYDLDPEKLPSSEPVPGAVAFREPKDSKTLGLIANGIALGIAVVTIALLFIRGGFAAWNFFGALAARARALKGVEAEGEKALTLDEFREREFDRIARIVRASLDMEKIYGIIRA